MQFSTFFATAALSGLAAAVQLTNVVYNDITAGTTYSIGWSNATGPVTLLLKNGGANNLQTVSTITSDATTSPYSWSVPANLPADTYALEISDSTGSNYSPQFQLLGATASASATASRTGSSSSSASGSSTASSSVVHTSTSVSSVATLTASANSTSSTATGASNSTASATGSSSGASAGSSKTTTAAGGSKTSTAAGSSSSVPASNSATEFASPLALVFLTFAAILTLN